MKLKKPSAKTATQTAAITGGVIVGGALSKGVFGLIHENTVTDDPTAQKKAENMGLIKRAAIIVATGAGAAFLDGNDSLSSVTRGSLIGMAAVQTLEVVATLAKRGGVTPESSASTASQKFLARTTGLGCPCNSSTGLAFMPPAYSPRYSLSLENDRGLGNPDENDIWETKDLWSVSA